LWSVGPCRLLDDSGRHGIQLNSKGFAGPQIVAWHRRRHFVESQGWSRMGLYWHRISYGKPCDGKPSSAWHEMALASMKIIGVLAPKEETLLNNSRAQSHYILISFSYRSVGEPNRCSSSLKYWICPFVVFHFQSTHEVAMFPCMGSSDGT
jgi:hypothetical protein